MLPTLTKNTDFWLASWRDSGGNRRFKNLGRRTEIGVREAERRLAALIGEHAKNPGRRDVGRAPALGDFLDHYFLQRTDLDESTVALQRTTRDRLLDHFSPALRMDSITRNQASGFRTWLASWTYTRGEGCEVRTLGEASIRKHMATAKQIFQWATSRDLIPFNPFDREKLGAAPAQQDWHYVDVATMEKVYAACPNQPWRTAFALARLAGLRLNEISRAEWTWIDWGKPMMVNIVPKLRKGKRTVTTKQSRREVPVSPMLATVLHEAWEAAGDGDQLICPSLASSPSHKADAILAAAGLAWSKPMHSLRKSLETDWLALHPIGDVCKWLGHDPAVAFKHYHKTKPETIERVTEGATFRATDGLKSSSRP